MRAEVRRVFFPGAPAETPIVVLGSVRPTEERWWFDGFEKLKQRGVPLKMIVAPRHAERFSYFADRIAALGVPYARWSDRDRSMGTDVDILLLDTMGKLEEAYSIADLAFVGATLVDVGGHNPIEPAMYGAPVVVGPHISVIRDIIEDMRSCGGVIEVSDAERIPDLLERVACRDRSLEATGRAGHGVWQRHRGAAHRILSVLGDN
jgi:3-deoxy-D-manno-octulosonic-acid transferase